MAAMQICKPDTDALPCSSIARTWSGKDYYSLERSDVRTHVLDVYGVREGAAIAAATIRSQTQRWRKFNGVQ